MKPVGPGEPELDLYTIPIQSSWFAWDDIHGTEKVALREFFDGNAISRTPRIYKEYRDFIINKYREDPSRRLTFTEVRKSLVADVSLLNKVFKFLEQWGLINFGVSIDPVIEGEESERVWVEEGAPNGVRVVAMPNSLKPVSVPQSVGGRQAVENVPKLPPLTSYTDTFGDLIKRKGLVCRNCGERCGSGCYECTKDHYMICTKCFNNGNFGENKSVDDFKFINCSENSGDNKVAWTEPETLLLLESILKHGDNWELVAENVQTKTKLDCIEKLIELPFGEFLLSSAQQRGNFGGSNGDVNGLNQLELTPSQHQWNSKTEAQQPVQTNESEQNGNDVELGSHPSKRKCIALPSDANSSLMKKVARISTMVSSQVTAAAAEAAVTTLCEESSFPREIFDGEEYNATNGLQSPTLHYEQASAHQVDGSEMKHEHTLSENEDTSAKNDIPLTLQLRAATATTLGAAAAHAKLLADQEHREMENLVATIIDTLMKKLHRKIRHFEDLELIMEKEYAEMEQEKECIIAERIDVLQKTFNAGISMWKSS
ncbi:SWI/SNF complex subunit SWI3A isoform X2 [Tripterygium wilfordii]|uniref:SWI/SNF complex subunit SWI3A isoform X2 n=2 Tax=Tripterygium wilfordii TaxID=458696 RepID=A0A7J7CDQ4_TRIWF|nr:SWI/SNF complex subunit SWI3A isoform X2 [Tripterygium wilfordii]